MVDVLEFKTLAKALKDAGSPWEMDETNELALLTEEERRRRLGFIPPAGEMTLEEAVVLDAEKAPIMAQELAAEAIGLPTAYDLRNVGGKDFTTSVKNQGGCGSCVAFGTVAVMETTLKRRRNDPNLDIDLSEAQMFYCHGAEEGRHCANGWWPENALKKAEAKGITFEQFFPYTAGNQACSLNPGWQGNLAKPTGHTKINSRADMKKWIATRGSITGCFIVYQDFFQYGSGVYRHVTGNNVGGHCVEIIGYDDAQMCWICKNSWGQNWGEASAAGVRGYFRIGYGECGIETLSGPFGANEISLKSWARDTRVRGLWTNRSDRNAYVHLSGQGWRKIADTNVAVQHAMLAELVTAKASNRRVDALIENNRIRQVYVI